ncbi:MAG: YfhO family protein [Lachnospiraceae bacterium]|nr:YfhO family protein [Lachnospiraceae bacterium]
MSKERLTHLNRKTILILLSAVFVTCLIAFSYYVFGNEVMAFEDIGSDTSQQYLTQYATIISKLRAGDWSMWNEFYGLGANMYMLNMFNPLLIILYAVGALFGFAALPKLIIWWYIGEILLSAFSAYVFLSVFKLDEKAKAIASYMFAFNGFLLIWGQHYQFGVVCVIFPLLLWAIERVLRDPKRYIALILTSAVCVLNSMYLAYMMLLCAAFYVIFRVIMRQRFVLKMAFGRAVSCAWPMIVGLLIGGISLLPSYAAISNVSSRLASDLSLWGRLSGAFTAYPEVYYRTLLDRLLTGTGEGMNVFDGYLNYYEAPCMFFTGLFIVLLAQYVCLLPTQKSSLKAKVLQVIFMVLAAAGLYFPAAGVILNGFTAPFSRYTFLYMPYFLLIAAFTLHHIMTEKKLSLIALILGAVAGAGVMIWRYGIIILMPWNKSRRVMLLLLASGVCLAIGIIIYRTAKNQIWKKMVFSGLMLCLMINAGAEAWGNFTSREALEKDDAYFAGIEDEDTVAALEMIRDNDPGLYRIEKLYGSTICMDALLQDYRSVSVYNSTQNRYIIDYVDTYWPSIHYVDQNHFDFEEGVDNGKEAALNGVKYILLDREDCEGDHVPAGYSLYGVCGSVEIYKSDTVESIMTFYDDVTLVPSEKEEGVMEAAVDYDKRDTTAKMTFADDPARDTIAVEVTVKKDGLLFTGYPYEDGWQAYVDGVETPVVLTNKGFQGIPLTAGTHTIRLAYTCPLLKEGALMSAAGLVILAVLCALRYRKRKTTACQASTN